MIYDWEKLYNESIQNEFNQFRYISMFPMYELYNIDESDFIMMQKMVTHGIIIPIEIKEIEEINGTGTCVCNYRKY